MKPFKCINKWVILIGAVTGLFINFSGCASVIPRELRENLNLSITLDNVIWKPDSYKGEKVLWGGVISSTKNEARQTVIEVVQVPLGSYDRPGNIDESKGRFIVEQKGFLDRAIFAEGREITVAGEIMGIRKGKVGEMDYTFPLLKSIKIHLWEKKEEVEYVPSPFYCDPFYYPYYPYCRPYFPYSYPPRRK